MNTTMFLLCSGQQAVLIEGETTTVEAFKATLSDKGREMDIRQAPHSMFLMNDEKSFKEAQMAWKKMQKK